MVVGSSWPTEEQFLLNFISNNKDYKYIVAPHNINQSSIDQFIEKCTIPAEKYSVYKESKDKEELKVLVIDSIGLLSQIYKYGDVAIVGGGFNAGIHNILEAAVWGQPIMFGPKHENFKEAKDLLTLGGALTYSDQESFSQNLSILLSVEKIRTEKSNISEQYCLENKGATQIVMESLQQYLID